jgi:rhodanese-related sulfurtransferase
VAGYLEGGFESFVANGGKTGTVRIVPPKEFLVLEGEAGTQIKSNSDNHVVLDIRKPGEWSDGVLPNAVTITLQELEEKIEQVPRDKVIHVYCKSGGRAKMAASILQNNGVKEIVLATGGIDAIAAESNVKLSL